MLVVSIVAVIVSGSVIFSLPAMARYGCSQETEAAINAVGRARHLSQYAHKGDVKLEINDAGYEIVAQGEGGRNSILIDRLDHRAPVPVTANGNIVFSEIVGVPTEANLEILIGGETSSCNEVITINHVGAIL